MSRRLCGSNSVCGRIIQKEEFSDDDTGNQTFGNDLDRTSPSSIRPVDEMGLLSKGGLSSKIQHQRRSSRFAHSDKRLQRRVVRVLDFAELAKMSCGKPTASSSKVIQGKHQASQIKLIPFTERLHPWTTIKELKQKIHQTKGYHVHRQRLFLNNFELLNSETLDYYGLLQEQVKESHLQQMLQKVKTNLKITGSEKAPNQGHENETISSGQSEHIEKIVLLRLAPDLKKLSKLNAMNILKTKQQDHSDDRIQEQGESSPLPSPTKIQRSSPIKNDNEGPANCVELFASMQCPQELGAAIFQIEKGFRKGLIPKLTDDGTSGTYLLRGPKKEPLAVFKPIDEEAFAPNNPRDHAGPFGSQTFRAGVLSGEACIREVAAYLLDHNGFSGVPPTTMVENAHHSFRRFKVSNFKVVSECQNYIDMISSIIAPENQLQNQELRQKQDPLDASLARFLKVGSLQSFIQSQGPIENFSSDLFSDDEIHKIAILDLRLLNLDRNECNILVQRSFIPSQYEADTSMNLSIMSHKESSQKKNYSWRLIPIDHGLSIPDTLEVCSFDLVWLSYAQAEKPFSQKSLEYIRNIDIMEDIRTLENTFKFRPQCLRNMRISATLLQKGAEAGLTLAQIGQILCRPDDDDEQPSLLEQMVRRARTCSNMMAQIQTRIKDSTLRLIQPSKAQNYKIMTPRRRYTSRQDQLMNFDSDDGLSCDESEDSFLLKHDRITFQNIEDDSSSCQKEEDKKQEVGENTLAKVRNRINQTSLILQSLGEEVKAHEEKASRSPLRKRGYSDFDQINLNELKLNIKASLQKVCDQKIKHKKTQGKTKVKGKGKKAQGKAQLSKQLNQVRERQKQIENKQTRLFDISSQSSSQSGDETDIDQSMFKGFDFANPSQPAQASAPKYHEQSQPAQATSAELNGPMEPDKPEEFACALKKFSKKIQRTQPTQQTQQRGRSKFVAKAKVQRRLQNNLSKIREQKSLKLRRTSSFAGIRIAEDSDEERDSEKEGEGWKQTATDPSALTESKGIRKNSSHMSLMSLSKGSASSQSVGFWHKRPSHCDDSRKLSFNESQGDQLRYHQRRRHDIFSGNQTAYKQRMAKLNLERDLKWNGPHDEEFFRFFEQYLDDAIKKFLHQEDSSPKDKAEQLQAGTSQFSSNGFIRTPQTPEDHQGSEAKDLSSKDLLFTNNSNTPNVNTFNFDLDSPENMAVEQSEADGDCPQKMETQSQEQRYNIKTQNGNKSDGSRGTRSSS